jgi:CheY-like chemotaxis protein
MNGIEAVRHIRAAGPSRGARIVGITARVDLLGSEEGNPAEMNGVLFKPFGIAELETFLTETAPLPPSGPTPTDAMGALRATLEMCGPLLGLELLRDTLALARQAMDEAETDHALCAETAHRAAGAAMMSGLHDLGRALRDLEQAGRNGDDPAALPMLAARLADATGRAERLVAELELETRTIDAIA